VDAYHREQLREGYVPCLQPRYNVFLELLSDLKEANPRILDIGCHFGDFLIYYLRASGYENLMGLDISEVAVSILEREGIPVVLGDIEDPHIGEILGGGFDCIFMGDVLEHIFEPRRVLETIHNLLVADGRLILSVPNAGWLPNGLLLTFAPRLLGLSPAFGSWTHCNQFTLYTLQAMLYSCGFSVQTCRGVKYQFVSYFTKSGVKQRIGNGCLKLMFAALNSLAERCPNIFSPHLIVSAKKGV